VDERVVDGRGYAQLLSERGDVPVDVVTVRRVSQASGGGERRAYISVSDELRMSLSMLDTLVAVLDMTFSTSCQRESGASGWSSWNSR
jgi:hypothetical protein